MIRGTGLMLLVGVFLISSQAAPPEPTSYNVRLRYEIFAYRSDRVARYQQMLKTLQAVGFQRDPTEVIADDEPDNPKATTMRGTIPTKQIDELFRDRHVRSLLLTPASAKLPDKGRVRVEIRLTSGLAPHLQQALARQTVEVLTRDAEFIEAVGYDARDNQRIVGSVPVEQLDKLFEDVRQLPSATESGSPLLRISPIRIVFVRPDLPIPAGQIPPPPIAEQQRKYSADLRALLASNSGDNRSRMEVILGWTPSPGDTSWPRLIESSGATIEGRVGPLVTIAGEPKTVAPRLAALPQIAHVRLPRPALRVTTRTGDAPTEWLPLRGDGSARLSALNQQGTRLALVADDFAGWTNLKGNVRLVDLTAERNRDLRPDPFPSSQGEGHGTRVARSLLALAPAMELTLVRIDAAAPYQLETLARSINGSSPGSLGLPRRLAELRNERRLLDRESEALAEARRRVLENPKDDEPGRQAMAAYRKKLEAFEREEQEYAERRNRYFDLLGAMQGLRGTRLVALALAWPDGYPLQGNFSRHFDEQPFRAALWFQAVGDVPGQIWSGRFVDRDQNGRLEFVADPRLATAAGSWSPELNFLVWQPSRGPEQLLLPAGTRLRLALQWREPHDPLPLKHGDDVYREPLSRFQLVLVRQPDPEGQTRPRDDLEVVAKTDQAPTRLHQTLHEATYELTLDLEVKTPGRYAVYLEGQLPESLHAPSENHLPTRRKPGEIVPRLTVRTLSGQGQAVWSHAHGR